MLTGIKSSKGNELVTVNIDTGNVESTVPVEYYVVGSTFFDNVTGCYGYVNGDAYLKLVDPLSGVEKKSVKLPGFLSFAVTDESTHELFGLYTEQGKGGGAVCDTTPEPGGLSDTYILRINLSEGTIISEKKVVIDESLVASVYYYEKSGKKLVVLRGDRFLLKIDPVTGNTETGADIGKNLFNAVFNEKDNTLIGLVYSIPDNRNKLEVINASTGITITSNMIENEDGFCLNVAGFDSETNAYFTVNGNNEVIFYSIASGEILKRVKLDNPLNDMKFWRRNP